MRGCAANNRQASRKAGRGGSSGRDGAPRGSCFHNAMMLRNIVTIAAPCTTPMSFTSVNERSSQPKTRLLSSTPSSSITYISATTRGRVSAGAMSVASARPAVCVVCNPAPASANASAAAMVPIHAGPCVSPDRISSANGMIAKPPNCISEPNHR